MMLFIVLTRMQHAPTCARRWNAFKFICSKLWASIVCATVRLVEQFNGVKVNGPDDLVAILDGGDEEFTRLFQAARSAWEEAFPLASDFAGLELKADLLIPHLIANRTITILAAPIESYKSIYAMHISHALLTGKPAFEHFPVAAQVSKVIYCVPDMSFELALRYARDIGLDRKGINFHIRTMKQGELLGMDSNAPK